MSAQDPLEAPVTSRAVLWRAGAESRRGNFLGSSRSRKGLLMVTGGVMKAQQGDSGELGKLL